MLFYPLIGIGSDFCILYICIGATFFLMSIYTLLRTLKRIDLILSSTMVKAAAPN